MVLLLMVPHNGGAAQAELTTGPNILCDRPNLSNTESNTERDPVYEISSVAYST